MWSLERHSRIDVLPVFSCFYRVSELLGLCSPSTMAQCGEKWERVSVSFSWHRGPKVLIMPWMVRMLVETWVSVLWTQPLIQTPKTYSVSLLEGIRQWTSEPHEVFRMTLHLVLMGQFTQNSWREIPTWKCRLLLEGWHFQPPADWKGDQ